MLTAVVGVLIKDEIHPRISGERQHVQHILEDEITRAEFVQAAEETEEDADYLHQCISFVIAVEGYKRSDTGGIAWGHRFFEKYHSKPKGRNFLNRLLKGRPLPYNPTEVRVLVLRLLAVSPVACEA